MKINYLKINGYGKIKNKEINLDNNINLIYGKNESGKSTLLSFINSMLYGISKNKNGKDISDFEKYKPWVGEDFSGKIAYTLDNNKNYEIFRDFSKKNPKIYNNNEEISKEFNIDKNKGNTFFYEQTKIDEELFLSTTMVMQKESVLDEKSQNLLTQKITNLLSSGEDNTSYKKIMDNLNKKLIEEVGTDRTSGRPLNEINEKIEKLKLEKNKLNNIENINNEIKINKKEIEESIINLQNEINLLNKIKNIKENEKIENEKIKINKNIEIDLEEKINNLKNKLNNEKNNNKNNKLNKFNIFLILILIIINIVLFILKTNKIFKITTISVTLVYFLFILFKKIINKNKTKKIKQENNLEKIKINKEIEILEENKNNKINEINKIEKNILEKNSIEINLIKNEFNKYFNNNEINNLFNNNLEEIINNLNELNILVNNKKLELNTLNYKQIDINEKAENMLKIREKLEYLTEEKEELLKLEKSILIAKNTLEDAYAEMKGNITPKFTKDLSTLMENISSNKYKNIKFNPENGLTVENENGEYISCNKLSIGTIDELYLALRLSIMNEISKETMPIILDEAFAYYDNERLENILKFISDNYKDNQIIIFTCTNRENKILEKLNIKYNLINI